MTGRLSITIQTPAHANTRLGNRVTAERWASILRALGHDVTIATAYDGEPADLMIAIHACRSASAVNRFHRAYPSKPIVVCLSGTDVYAFQDSHPEPTHATMEAATALVGLHDLVGNSIPARFRGKLHVIYQSADALTRVPAAQDAFYICVIGHLRQEKDPLRTAAASQLLPAQSRIRITQAGRAMDDAWAAQATAEMAANKRYTWVGEISGDGVRELLARTQLMVLSSVMEGGANVLGEAIAAGVPVIVSAIEGSLGLLGSDFPGSYPAGDTQALALLLRRAETDAAFLAMLTQWSKARAPLFAPSREQSSWARLIAGLTQRPAPVA
jgi:putative glycosyltransferase (TIGR04348 family)